MDKQLLDKSLENFFLNSNIQIDFGNFFIAILVSLILAYIVKLTYIKVGRALNDKEYFSDTFIPLAIITTLVITVIKFSLALSLGLVGALSIVRFRAAIKEPEELVYLFFYNFNRFIKWSKSILIIDNCDLYYNFIFVNKEFFPK